MFTLHRSVDLAAIVHRLSIEIGADHPDGVTLMPIMRGGLVFAADLARLLPGDVRVAPVIARRVGVKHLLDEPDSVEVDLLTYSHECIGRPTILVDGVLDSGATAVAVKRYVSTLGPSSLQLAALYWKRCKTRHEVVADYVGAVIGDLYVFGYGMDRDGRDRQLPYVAALDEDEIAALA